MYGFKPCADCVTQQGCAQRTRCLEAPASAVGGQFGSIFGPCGMCQQPQSCAEHGCALKRQGTYEQSMENQQRIQQSQYDTLVNSQMCPYRGPRNY